MDQFDNNIKNRIFNYESPVDGQIWEKVEANLVAGKRRRGLIFYLSLGGLMITIAAASLILNGRQQSNSIEELNTILSSSIKSNPVINSSVIERPSIPSNNIKSTPTLENNNSSIDEDISTSSNINVSVTHLEEHSNSKQFREATTLSNVETFQNAISPEIIPAKIMKHNLEIAPLPKKINKLENIITNKQDLISCPTGKKSTGNPLTIDFYTSLDYPISSRGTAFSESQQFYINERNRTESAIISFHGGVRLEKPITNQISLRLGMEYAQINERFQLIDSGEIRVQTVIDSIFGPDGTLIDIQSSTVTQSGIREINHYNHIKMFTVPISVGYYKDFKNFQLHVHAGAQFTILSSYSGKILSPSLSGVTINSNGAEELTPYKNNFGLNIIGSIGISRPFSENWSLLIEPNFRYTLKSISLSSYPVSQKYLVLGISTGLRYHF